MVVGPVVSMGPDSWLPTQPNTYDAPYNFFRFFSRLVFSFFIAPPIPLIPKSQAHCAITGARLALAEASVDIFIYQHKLIYKPHGSVEAPPLHFFKH